MSLVFFILSHTFRRSLTQLVPCSSKGSLSNSPGHMFVFVITTVIFILATTVIFFGPGLTTQGIPFIIKMIEPSLAVGWSQHKLNVVVGVIAVISRLNVRIRLVSKQWYNEETPLYIACPQRRGLCVASYGSLEV